MPILLSCDQCGREYKVKTKLAGHRFRCKNCAYVIHVPIPESETGAEEKGADHPAGDESAGDQAVDDEPCRAPVPPSTGGIGLPPASRSPSTTAAAAVAVPSGKPKPQTEERTKKNRLPIPWKLLSAAAAAVAVIGMLVMIALQDRDSASETRSAAVTFNASPADRLQTPASDQPEADSAELPQPDTATSGIIWQRYQLTGQPFSILMPGSPKPMSQPRGGLPITGAVVELSDVIEGAFSIMCIEESMDADEPVDLEKLFAGTKKGMLRKLPLARLTQEREVSITDLGGNVHPGREYHFEGFVGNREIHFTYRLFQVGPRMVTAFTGMDSAKAAEQKSLSEKFLSSLQVIASIPPVPSTTRPGEELKPETPQTENE